MPKDRSSTKDTRSLSDLTPDPQNANRGTARGREALAKSLQEYGPGRAVLIDRHNTIIAGNKTYERAKQLNIPVRVAKSDGTTLIAVQREPARELQAGAAIAGCPRSRGSRHLHERHAAPGERNQIREPAPAPNKERRGEGPTCRPHPRSGRPPLRP